MKGKVKMTILIAVLGLCLGAIAKQIENPKPTKLAASITREIKKVTQ